MDWDDQGRMWVGELRTYMIDLDGSNENGAESVMVLEDTDGDGKMDKSTAFVDDMINAALHRLCRRRRTGRRVGALWFCQDKDGDLVCDKKEKLIDFATSAHGNIEHAENALHFALDNWMYNSKSSRKLAWRRGKIVQMPARGRGNGAWVRMPMDAFTSMPTVIGSKSTGQPTTANGRAREVRSVLRPTGSMGFGPTPH